MAYASDNPPGSVSTDLNLNIVDDKKGIFLFNIIDGRIKTKKLPAKSTIIYWKIISLNYARLIEIKFENVKIIQLGK